MNESEAAVECGAHGNRPAAFVCQHLVAGNGRGFHCASDPEMPDQLCPDAWCDLCEEAFQTEGEWNDRSEAVAKIAIMCDRCYEVARERNWRQDSQAFERLVLDAMSYLKARQAALTAEFRIGEYERYDWYQDTGQLVFLQNGQARVVANIQFVGSVSSISDTWLWAWANESYVEAVKADVRKVRTYGAERQFLRLASARWEATEVDGWEMTAVAAFLLQAQGAYRSPSEQGAVFMTLSDVRWVQ